MKLLFVADANSPIARSWIGYFAGRGDAVHVVSHYPVARPLDGVHTTEVPLLLARAYGLSATGRRHHAGETRSPLRRAAGAFARAVNARLALYERWVGHAGPWEARRVADRIAAVAAAHRPDLVHALRIPMEAESAVRIARDIPLVVSIWGNDFTLWHRRYAGHRAATRAVLERASAIHADCERDIRLARSAGFDAAKPTLVVPGGGGIRLDHRPAATALAEWRRRLAIADGTRVVVNPRGLRPYVRTAEYLEAVGRVRRTHPDTVFVSVGVADDPAVRRQCERFGIADVHHALPVLSQDDLAALLELADVMVSPTVHDGTPNTLLEAMAHGAVPVVGDVESLREWIADGRNGVLVDARNPASVAEGMRRVLDDAAFRARAADANRAAVGERADYNTCMGRVREFYELVVDRRQAASATTERVS